MRLKNGVFNTLSTGFQQFQQSIFPCFKPKIRVFNTFNNWTFNTLLKTCELIIDKVWINYEISADFGVFNKFSTGFQHFPNSFNNLFLPVTSRFLEKVTNFQHFQQSPPVFGCWKLMNNLWTVFTEWQIGEIPVKFWCWNCESKSFQQSFNRFSTFPQNF